MMQDSTLLEELNSLKFNLAQTREKFITSWTTEQYDHFRNKQSKLFRNATANYKDAILQYVGNCDDCMEKCLKNEKALEEKTRRLALLKQEIENITNEINNAEDHRETLSSDLRKTQQAVEQIATKSPPATSDTELEELQSELELYRDSLDLQMRKTSGGRLQFIFGSVDRKNAETKCYFFMKISEGDRKYIVSDCEPEVEDMDVLVEKLNQTNNLKSFVIAMRKRFKLLYERKH